MLDGVYMVLMGIELLSCLGSAYIMLFLDISMYFTRNKDGSKSGTKYLSFGKGMRDAM